jgi:hypothetical protein
MRIDIKNPKEFTIENLKKLIASGDDSVNTQFRVTNDGFLFISENVGNKELDGILFRLETNIMGNGYVGQTASENENWVSRIYNVVNENWPDANSSYIDVY